MNTTRLCGRTSEILVGEDQPVRVIGAMINSAASREVAKALAEGDTRHLVELGTKQVAAGVDVLDVHIDVDGADEATMMARAVKELDASIGVPLCLDSSSPRALASGLDAASGRPLVNSVAGAVDHLKVILPLVKDRDCAVIGLCMDESGVPMTSAGRLAIAQRIVDHAVRIGIPIEDVLIDPLVLSIGLNPEAALLALETCELIREDLGANITLGVSNVSFGLPRRKVMSAALMALAVRSGATSVIASSIELVSTARALDVLLGFDRQATRYLSFVRGQDRGARLAAKER